VTGGFGLAWSLWWWLTYRQPSPTPAEPSQDAAPGIAQLLAHREVRAIVLAKFLSDGAWYFYLFWLPKYLFEAHHFDLKQAATIGWIPYAASGVGSLCGGFLSSRLLASGYSVNAARKIALGLSAACMPWVMLAPAMASVGAVIAIFSLAFFGQQSWSTLVMTLPTDLAPRSALGRLAGLVGLGGAFGGIVMGQAAGWALDAGSGYGPVLTVAALLHLIAFALICLAIPALRNSPSPERICLEDHRNPHARRPVGRRNRAPAAAFLHQPDGSGLSLAHPRDDGHLHLPRLADRGDLHR
jgi:ACS family hexuronate transporter-like MFS transporter